MINLTSICSSSISSSSSSSKIVYLGVTSQIYTNKAYSKTKDIRDPAQKAHETLFDSKNQ